jgi:hypothetical protein
MKAATRKVMPRRMLIELPIMAKLFSKYRVLVILSRLLFMKVRNPKRENPNVRITRLMLVDIFVRHFGVFTAVVVCMLIAVLPAIVSRFDNHLSSVY